MKTRIFISCLFLIFALNASGQGDEVYSNSPKTKSSNESFFKYGLKFGYDMQPITINPQEMLEQLNNGFQAGVYFQLGRTIYLQPEIYYASYRNLTSSISDEKIQSVRAPIMLGVRFLNLGLVSTHLMAGPVFTAPMSELSGGFSMDKFTYNWQVGAGVVVLGFITADVRYTLINGVELSDQFSYFNIDSSPLNITVGIKL
ncbi:MAG: outer membrane beta-barrel protein [Paludibacter sp.]|nr:outer membrane beta-barrel protein [Paludibacter sp.]